VPVDENKHIWIVHPGNLHGNLVLQPDLVYFLVLFIVQEERISTLQSLVGLSIFIQIWRWKEGTSSHLAVKNHKAFSYSEENPGVCSALSGVRDTTTAFLPIDDSLTARALAADHHSADEAQCRTFHLACRGPTDIVWTGEGCGEVHQVGVVAGKWDQPSSHACLLVSKIGEREVGSRLWSAEGDWWKTVPIVKRRGRKRKGNSVCSPTKKPLEEGGGRWGLDQLLQGAREAEVPGKYFIGVSSIFDKVLSWRHIGEVLEEQDGAPQEGKHKLLKFAEEFRGRNRGSSHIVALSCCCHRDNLLERVKVGARGGETCLEIIKGMD